MDYIKVFQKGILGFITGLAAVALYGAAQALTNHNPVVCTEVIVDNCTPHWLNAIYMSIVPVITGSLVALANWLKNRNKT